MQIEIDFEVFQKLTSMRRSEADGYNAVIRRLLGLDSKNTPALDALAGKLGATFGGVYFPESTKFMAGYKGVTFRASIIDGRWVNEDGSKCTSPSDAAGRVTGKNVNGWTFWSARRPGESQWVRIDKLRTRL